MSDIPAIPQKKRWRPYYAGLFADHLFQVGRVPGKLPYNPAANNFVDRKEALRLVLDRAVELAQGEAEERVFIVRGPRGSGKSWLLGELKKQASHNGLHAHSISAGQHDAADVIRTFAERKGQFANIRDPRLLLIDDVDEAGDLDFSDLESALTIAAQQTDLLIVLAERGQPRYWSVPEFRFKSKEIVLLPFELPDIREQLQKQVKNAAPYFDEIDILGHGYPWNTYVLGHIFPADVDSLTQYAQELFDKIDDDLKLCLEALAVLQAFDEDRMIPLLQAFSLEFAAANWSYKLCRDIRDRLLKTTLVTWDAEARGYVVDEALRAVLEAKLYARDPRLWECLHGVAYQLYADWAVEFEQSGAWWALERDYHKDRLELAGCAVPALR